jgi:outer membrane protein TolC
MLICATASAETITLEDARSQALAANEDAAIAKERIRASRGLRRQVLADMLPALDGSLSGLYSGPEVIVGDRPFTRTYDWRANVSASMRLVDLSLYPALDAADRRVELAENEAEWVQKSLTFEVELAFFELAAAERTVAIAESTVELRRAYYEQAQALAEQGIALPLDAARARAQKLEADQVFVEAKAALGNAADRLAVLLAKPTNGELRAQVDVAQAQSPPATEGERGTRADVVALEREAQARALIHDSVFWSLFPFITLSGNTRFSQPSLPAPDGVQWSVVLALNWTLYDGGRRYGRLEQTEAETEIAELQLARAKREMSAELTQALRDWRAAWEAVKVADERQKVAAEAYDMAKARFDSGLATSIEVNESSDALLRAELEKNNAILAVDTAAARYRWVKGASEETP